MKVFMCQRRSGYSGGLAVVAANSVEEAFKTFFDDSDYVGDGKPEWGAPEELVFSIKLGKRL